MGPDGWITIGVLGAVLVTLVLELFSVDFVMLTALVLLVLLGVLDLDTALQGFANSTLLALGSLFVIAGGLRKAGALDLAAEKLLGREKNLRRALARLSATATTSSAFLNNTPVVAMGIPAVRNWAKSRGISPSKLLIPLSYASILGGICTLIGTSTNLVTHGLLQSHGMEGFSFFELAAVGVPAALVGSLYLVFVAPNLLPEREEVREAERRERGPLLELEVEEGSTVVGKSLQESGLAALPGHSLIRVQRGDEVIGGTEVEEQLTEGDILEYERVEEEGEEREGGEPEETGGTLSDLSMALRPRTHRPPTDTERHEVVVREGSGLIGRTVEEIDFPERFGARVTGVRRGGARVKKPLNEIILRLGDVLVLETGRGFRHAFEESPQFYITSEAGAPGERETDTEREPEEAGITLAGSILAAVIGLAALGVLHIAVAATLGAFAMVAFGFLTPGEARESVDWSVLVVIGAALGLGQGMEVSGAAEWVGRGIVDSLATLGPIALLIGVYVATVVLTEIITNNGAAALLFPIALTVAQSQGLDPRPFMIGITVAASTSMLTPIGYQTNLMVYGAGNYKFTDFARAGGGLQALVATVAILLIPRVWGF